MKDYQSLNYTHLDCKYHVVFIPKCRKTRIFGSLRKDVGEIFHEVANRKNPLYFLQEAYKRNNIA